MQWDDIQMKVMKTASSPRQGLSVAATSNNQLMQIQIQLLLRIIHISVTRSMKSLFHSQMSMSAWEQRLKIKDQSDVEVLIRHLWENEAGVRSLLVAKGLNTQHYPLPFVLLHSASPSHPSFQVRVGGITTFMRSWKSWNVRMVVWWEEEENRKWVHAHCFKLCTNYIFTMSIYCSIEKLKKWLILLCINQK